MESRSGRFKNEMMSRRNLCGGSDHRIENESKGKVRMETGRRSEKMECWRKSERVGRRRKRIKNVRSISTCRWN